ncbi:MAG: cell division protein ZapA [Leptospirales bacterium]|nr:cell division protein ZapA [Leptospirales bacterium]
MASPATIPEARVAVEILGERFVIRGDAEAGYIAEVARIVDDRLRDLSRSSPGASRARIATLLALNLADELMQEKNRGGDHEELRFAAERTRQLIDLLDEGLIGESV